MSVASLVMGAVPQAGTEVSTACLVVRFAGFFFHNVALWGWV